MTKLHLASSVRLENSVVTTTVSTADLGDAPGWRAGDLPAQVTHLAGGTSLVGVYVPELDAGASLDLDLTPAEAEDAGRGIRLDDQPENGRIVVWYSGLLQTIYHYGAQHFKPRFYPVCAPCGRPGDMEGPDVVYPKSITDDSPPDHIWHRSIWYACGELNEYDFYLENGGEGRTVHQSFSDVFSGPLFGGFRESLAWIAPDDGRTLLTDERSFVHYRLKGRLRVFDIDAAFTATDEPITFGQTNENALPLIRVADVIDEWDGGTINLADGTTGGKDAFGKRSPWADCSGPLVRRGEPETYGIAMLDHPSNRNHPNAWFARSYGPLGTNLPYFDGPLTLEPGETWSMRHRIVIHEGGAADANIQRHFDEYASDGLLTLV